MTTKKEVMWKHLKGYLKVSCEKKGVTLIQITKTFGTNRGAVVQAFSRIRRHDPCTDILLMNIRDPKTTKVRVSSTKICLCERLNRHIKNFSAYHKNFVPTRRLALGIGHLLFPKRIPSTLAGIWLRHLFSHSPEKNPWYTLLVIQEENMMRNDAPVSSPD